MERAPRPRLSQSQRNLLWWVVTVTGVALVGGLGYTALEHWSLFDGLYMAITIISSVGLKELRPMNRAGDVWTMILAVTSVLVIFGTVGLAAETIATEFGTRAREKRRMERTVGRLQGHYIVCGYGRVGAIVTRELAADGQDIVVLDDNVASRERAVADGFLTVAGDATADEALVAAGIERAKGLFAVVDSDPANVYTTITARALNPGLFIVARASTRAVMHKLELAGADRAISPYQMAARRAVQLATRPGVVDFIDAALSRGELSFSMEEVVVEPGLAGFSVGELGERGLSTMAIRQEGGDYEPNPPGERVLSLGEALIVSGSTADIAALASHGTPPASDGRPGRAAPTTG